MGTQVETRKFSIDPCLGSIDDIEKHVICYNTKALNEYKESLKCAIESGRKYDHIGYAGCDNLFEVEALGIAKYCKRYTMILDLSDSLDYMLHRLSKCNIDAIRNMPNYSKISNAIMNYRFDDVEQIFFNSFFQIDHALDEYFVKLLGTANDVTISSDNKMNWIVNKFYVDIINTACSVKDYTMTFLRSKLQKNTFAYRSKSYSAALASVENVFDENIIFHQDGYEDYNVDIKCYEPFGYIKGRVFI